MKETKRQKKYISNHTNYNLDRTEKICNMTQKYFLRRQRTYERKIEEEKSKHKAKRKDKLCS